MKKKLLSIISTSILSLIPLSSSALELQEQLTPELIKTLGIDPNKITLIDFFASWCVSCRIELPQISALIPQLDNNQFEVIGINVDEELSEGQEYIDSFAQKGGLNFRVVMDPEQQMIEIFEPLGMPALYYIQNGKIEIMHLGAMPNIDDVIVSDISKLGYQQ
jgi:cytochrome c biogenesis protein CcmG/thiol:disulfide interchange protein DsbE